MGKETWVVESRMFSEEDMYQYVLQVATKNALEQTLKALPFAKKLHEGAYRKNRKDSEQKVPYIYHPLIIANQALSMGIVEDDIIAAILLHDVVEDCDVTKEELPVSKDVQEAVALLSFEKLPGLTKEESKRVYYDKIATNRIATVVKVMDRCNNISSMGTAFSKEKIEQYVDETDTYVMPLLKILKEKYPEFETEWFLLNYHMRSVLDTIKGIWELYN